MGMRKMKEDATRANKPARRDVPTYHATTDAANLPARPLRTRVAIAGLRAARIRRGTTATTPRINHDVAFATGSNGPGKRPPRRRPDRRASKVQT
jgi:hypothetical protein